jgi:hypothetical protein
MKTLKISAIILLASMLSISACKKEPGFEGKNMIKGKVSLQGAPAANAIVHIAFDKKEATTDYNSSTVTDANGEYSFSALSAGDYFVDAEYTKVTNFGEITLKSPGATVTIGSKEEEITVDLTLE